MTTKKWLLNACGISEITLLTAQSHTINICTQCNINDYDDDDAR